MPRSFEHVSRQAARYTPRKPLNPFPDKKLQDQWATAVLPKMLDD